MVIKRGLISLVLVVILSLALAVPVMAVPQIPHAFYGNVTVGSEPAPDNAVVSAKIGGVEYEHTTTSGGKYGYSPTFKVPGDDSDTPDKKEGGVEGDIITFYVGGVEAATYTFTNGEVTNLDLAIAELPSTPSGGGGGGGGGETTYYVTNKLFGTAQSFKVNKDGVLQEKVEATSADGNLRLTINKGTTLKDKAGERLTSISADIFSNPPAAPEDSHIIGLAYDFGPDGATFDPGIIFTWMYDPDALPEGVAEEDLVIAYYDATAGKWVELKCVVDAANNKITASVSHFTTFAIIGTITPPPPPAPAAFAVSGLVVSPGEVYVGESVSIRILLANTGGESGSCNVTLRINGTVEEVKEFTVSAGLSEEVTFSAVKDTINIYSVDVNGLLGSFTVRGKPVTVPTPAEFIVSSLAITPGEVYVGESVAVWVIVSNVGGESGSCNITLKINEVVEAAKEVTVTANSTQEVTFSVIKDTVDTYAVDVNGLIGSFTVKEKPEEVVPPGFNWPLIGGIIGAVIVVALVVLYFVRKRTTA